MSKRNILWTVCAAVAMLSLVPRAHAGGPLERTSYLTFSGPVRLPGVSLAAGTYVFEIANPMGDADIVRVKSRDGRTSYFQGFTYRIARPAGLRSDAVVSLGEAPAGAAPPVTAWWPIGESTGHQFVYRQN
jgi:hypothetical protein